MTGPPLLRLDQVSRIYGDEVKVHALDRVDLVIETGDFVSIVGPSGSGKSTMLGLLGLLDLPSLGTLEVTGESVGTLTDAHRSQLRGDVIGFIFQQFHLIPHLDARRNVETALLYRGLSARQRRDRAMDALDAVGLALRADAGSAQLQDDLAKLRAKHQGALSETERKRLYAKVGSIYQDGAEVSAYDLQPNGPATLGAESASDYFYLGNFDDQGTWGHPNGRLDEFKLYDYVKAP